MKPRAQIPTLRAVVLAAAILGPFLWFFGEAIFLQRSFVFRDAAHYYYPLFEWTGREWASGRVPLWNPQENCGVPVLADATSSVLYPGKLLFALPFVYAIKYKLYITGHIILAAAAAFCLARHWRASSYAAGLCAVSYAFGGSVLFQYANVVFLVGAAWLPLAFLTADRMLVARSLRWSLAFAAVLALMVLGGDPQAAYHAGLLSALYALFLWRDSRRPRSQTSPIEANQVRDGASISDEPRTLGTNRLFLLATAAVVAAILSAVQILPSAEWARRSQRAAYVAPRSIYEVPTCLARKEPGDSQGSIANGLFGAPVGGTHHEHIYHFSVGPWRLAEFLWPNFSGRLFPVNQRWMNSVPAEGRVWTPSLYMGLLPLLLACGCWRLRGAPAHVRWVSWTAFFGVLGSFGWYGLGWLIHEFRYSLTGAETDDVLFGQPIGGLYWLLVVVLPGYAKFRFPAKLLVMASLGLSVLAARGVDSVCTNEPRRLRRVLAGLTCISLTGFVLSYVIGPHWGDWMANAPRDGLFGPIDLHGSLCDLRNAFLHTAIVGGVFWWLLSCARSPGGNADSAALDLPRRMSRLARFSSANIGLIPATLLLVTAIDLIIANSWLVPTAPLRNWQTQPYFAQQIADREAARGDERSYRVFCGARQNWLPRKWSTTNSADRQRDGLRWDVDTLHPKYHLRTGLSLVEAYGTLSSHDYQTFLRIARHRGLGRKDNVAEPHPAVMGVLGAKYLLLPDDFVYPKAERITTANEKRAPENAVLWLNPNFFPRAWIVHEIDQLPAIRDSDPKAIETRTRNVLFPNGRPRDFRSTAVVEANTPIAIPSAEPALAPMDGGRVDESCEIVIDHTQRVVIDAELKEAGMIVLCDLYYPGWIAEVTTQGQQAQRRTPILRTNRIMRGVRLPPGKHRITFSYRPTMFYAGATLSVVGWLAWAIACTLWLRRRGRSPQASPSLK